MSATESHQSKRVPPPPGEEKPPLGMRSVPYVEVKRWGALRIITWPRAEGDRTPQHWALQHWNHHRGEWEFVHWGKKRHLYYTTRLERAEQMVGLHMKIYCRRCGEERGDLDDLLGICSDCLDELLAARASERQHASDVTKGRA